MVSIVSSNKGFIGDDSKILSKKERTDHQRTRSVPTWRLLLLLFYEGGIGGIGGFHKKTTNEKVEEGVVF